MKQIGEILKTAKSKSRLLLALLVLLAVMLLSACAENRTADTDKPIVINNPSVYTADFSQLYRDIIQRTHPVDDQISMSFLYEQPGADILFSANGEIQNMVLSLYAVLEESASEYEVGTYKFRSNDSHGDAIPTNLTVTLQERGEFAKESFKEVFEFSRFAFFCDWLSAFDLQSLLNKNEAISPVLYHMTTDNCLREFTEDENIHIEYYYTDSQGVEEVALTDFAIHEDSSVWLQFQNVNYCLIKPYYPKGSMQGLEENHAGESYTSNNLIIILFDEVN
jgi:hypothetical protein